MSQCPLGRWRQPWSRTLASRTPRPQDSRSAGLQTGERKGIGPTGHGDASQRRRRAVGFAHWYHRSFLAYRDPFGRLGVGSDCWLGMQVMVFDCPWPRSRAPMLVVAVIISQVAT